MFFKYSDDPPDIPGIPGHIARFAHSFRRATQIFPPFGIGVGAGIGLGCGFGWPLRKAYGPPRALCGTSIGVGVGLGYGQGFGRRFGRDTRPDAIKGRVSDLETWLDESAINILSPIRQTLLPQSRADKIQHWFDSSVSAIVTPVQSGISRVKQQLMQKGKSDEGDNQSSSLSLPPGTLFATNSFVPYAAVPTPFSHRQQVSHQFSSTAYQKRSTVTYSSDCCEEGLERLLATRDSQPVQIKRY